MTLDAFEVNKNTSSTNSDARLREMPFVSFGFIKEVISPTLVKVTPVVKRADDAPETLYVTLLSLSSALAEFVPDPMVGDHVLLFSLNNYHPNMFQSPYERKEENRVLVNPHRTGYTVNSMVGVLMSTAKKMSAVLVELASTEEKAEARLTTMADVNATVRENMSLGFVSSDQTEKEFKVFLASEYKTTKFRQGSENVYVGYKGASENLDDDEPTDAPTLYKHSSGAPITLETDSSISVKAKGQVDLLIDGEELITAGNSTATLGGILNGILDILANFITVGSPATQKTDPGTTAKIEELRSTLVDKVFG